MKISKRVFLSIIITISLLIGGVACANTCFDPYYNRYYYCGGNEYVYPEAGGVFFDFLIPLGRGGYDGHDGYRSGHDHGDHGNRGHGGSGGHHR